MSETEIGTEIVLAHSGVVVSLDDQAQVASALREVQEIQKKLAEAVRILKSAISYHASEAGTKTLHIDGVGKVEIKNDSEVVWDIEALEKRLRRAGASDELIGEIIVTTISQKVDARRANQAGSANPKYARAIELSKRSVPKMPTVSIS
jgi:ubiquinone/menaquinone biosynthesis C-methylase UbiE